MTTTVNLRKTLDRKEWEMMTPTPLAPASGSFITSSNLVNQLQLYIQAATVHYLYRPDEDSWLQIPSGAFASTSSGTCGCHHPSGPTGTATAGSASTITTALTIPGSLVGYVIRITGGTGAGQERTISFNTVGANAVITVSATWSVTPDATSVFLILSGRFWVWATTSAATLFKYYDVATNAWVTKSTTGPPAAWGTDGHLVSTPGPYGIQITGTSTGTNSTTTLNNTGKAWTTNQWTNWQVRITAGTGAGQIRTISSNTGTALTVSAVWTVTPDATSVYTIEGNDDALYLMGNNAVTMYKYSISGDTWSTLTPGAARAGSPTGGFTGSWVTNATPAAWSTENTIINGDRIYSFRGGGTNTLDYYSISANTWVSGITYQRQTETFAIGSSATYVGDFLYIQKDATGRFFRYNFPLATMDPWSTLLYAQAGAIVGDKTFDAWYTDGGTTIRWIYNLRNTGVELFRCLVI